MSTPPCPHRPPLLPPKPEPRAARVSLLAYLRLFRRDILSAQPARLYRAWMAEFRTPFFRSYLCNDPELVALILKERPFDFPKSNRISAGLEPLLGKSVFLTNGEAWQRQRRIIDPAFEGGRLRESFPAMLAAGEAAVARLEAQLDAAAAREAGSGIGPKPEEKPESVIRIAAEEEASHLAADVIFRSLFSLPIDHALAAEVFAAFRAYQRSQPLLNLAAFLPLPRWMPRLHRPKTLRAARQIRLLITKLTEMRAAEIARGEAPQDLATRIMTTPDPLSGETFSPAEMVDQVAIFFLAGHETSASALAWALYLLASDPEAQERAAAEAASLPEVPDIAALSRMPFLKDVFREALRLYPPVPMMVREARKAERFRNRNIAPGAQLVLSPWHLHRHEIFWTDPDHFCPGRWQEASGKEAARLAYLPFSAGPRVCPGAGFAMAEGVLLLALLLRRFHFAPVAGEVPVPVAHLTVRARDGIRLQLSYRRTGGLTGGASPPGPPEDI